jgi:hypothetical protein
MVWSLNKGVRDNEKNLYWSKNLGFHSDNSEDERIKYKRTERFYIYDRQKKYGRNVFLRKRPIKPFEKLMLKMGGAEIYRQLAGKQLHPEKTEYVYQWVDPNKEVFQTTGEFLIAPTKEAFDEKYAKEIEY